MGKLFYERLHSVKDCLAPSESDCETEGNQDKITDLVFKLPLKIPSPYKEVMYSVSFSHF
jgi:hypothetical protein